MLKNKFDNLVTLPHSRSLRQETEIKRYLDSVINIMGSTNILINNQLENRILLELLENELPSSNVLMGRNTFIKDIVELSNIFFNLTSSKKIEIQIDLISTNMCRLFHEDNMRQRLLCTYLGEGTEWLEESNLKREGLRKGCNKKIVRNFHKIKQAKTFEVILLKGSRYGKNTLSHIHRSPEIEKDKTKRVLLKIDEVIN